MLMKTYGYKGKIFPINPTREAVQGCKAYPDLGALPEIPEMAIVALAGENSAQAVTQCSNMGVKIAVVMASGFGETGAQGKKIQDEMLARAHNAGMRMVGPNCQGLANFGTGTIANFSTIFIDRPCIAGPVAIICQSGALSQVIYGLVHKRGLGIRHCHSTGNEADITVADLAAHIAQDSEVKLLLLYLETINNPVMLAEAATIARDRDLPILAIKSGRTRSGQRAASSHTGAMATEDRIVDAFLRHHGIWRASDPHDLVNAAELYLKGWRPQGRKTVVMSNSGATCVMAADIAEEIQLPLAEITEDTNQQLHRILPSYATTTNPVDTAAALLTDSRLFGKILEIVGSNADTDLFFAGISVAGTGYDTEMFARDAENFMTTTGKPLVMGVPQDEVAAPFIKRGVPVFSRDQDALQALNQLSAHTTLMRCRRIIGATKSVDLGKLRRRPEQFLNEADSMDLLATNGVSVAPYVLCHSEAEAREALQRFGGPVAVKACSAGIPHKSEFGLVALNLKNEEEVASAFNWQCSKVMELKIECDGIIVAEMIKGQREMVLGARVDQKFGPVVMLGDGGKYVEALKDFTLLMPPFDVDEVVAALDGLRIAPVLHGVRGEPPLDMEALAEIAVCLGEIIQRGRELIASIDLNPIMVKARGAGAVVADALIERLKGEPGGNENVFQMA